MRMWSRQVENTCRDLADCGDRKNCIRTVFTGLAKLSAQAAARRWLALREERQQNDEELERRVAENAPVLMRAHGIATLKWWPNLDLIEAIAPTLTR